MNRKLKNWYKAPHKRGGSFPVGIFLIPVTNCMWETQAIYFLISLLLHSVKLWNSKTTFFGSQACTEEGGQMHQGSAKCTNWVMGCEAEGWSWGWSKKLRLKQGLPLLLREAGARQIFLIAHCVLGCVKAPAIHASTRRGETGQRMLWHLLVGGKTWDAEARDQTAGLSSFYFSGTIHIYESSLGFLEWKKKKNLLKGFSMIFSCCCLCYIGCQCKAKSWIADYSKNSGIWLL